MKSCGKFKLLFLSFFINQVSLAQDGIISGRLQDQQEVIIPFATVSVMELPDSTVVTGTTTDLDGNFKLKPKFTGEFVLRFSAIGYSDEYTPAFRVSGPDFTRDFGVSTLEVEVGVLNEVMINTWKPRIKVESDKLVMTVEGTAVAAGNTAYGMLSRAPGVSVGQNGNFLINGKQGVAVMIDGRLTYLSPNELQSLLANMPAENISQIEVIHNPSAKYDAEGVAGILNIVLKENTGKGLNGSIYGGGQYNQQELYNAGLNLFYNTRRWYSSVNLDLAQRGYVRDQRQYRTFAGENNAFLDQTGKETKKSFVSSVQAGTEYRIDENHRIGITGNLIVEDRKNDWNTLTTTGELNSGDQVAIDARNRMDGNSGNGRFNLYYTADLDTSGTALSADLDYVRLERETDSRFLNYYTFLADDSERLEIFASKSLSDYDIYAAKVDFGLPFSRSSRFEAGIKASKVISNSELQFLIEENGNQVFDPQRSDRFRYEEDIYAAYANYSNRINSNWKFQAGLRAEQTYGEGRSFSQDQITPTEYLEFFPNLMLEQNVNDNYSLAYSYSRRIARPNYGTLNPFIFYLDPYSYIIGNTTLRPQFTNSFQVSQTLRKRYNLSLFYDISKDHMGEVPSMDPETRETIFTTRNMNNFRSYGANLVAPVEISTFWNINNTLVFNRQEYELQINGQPIENKDYFFMAQSNHQVNLPLKLKMELNFTYRSPYVLGIYDVNERFWLDAGFKRSFLNDRLDVSLRATDVFKTMQSRIRADFFENHYNMQQYFDQQAISFNLRYNISKGRSNQETRSNNLEELKRAGGG